MEAVQWSRSPASTMKDEGLAAPRLGIYSVVIDARQGAGEQEHDGYNEHQAKDTTNPRATPPAIAVVATTAEQKNQQDDNQKRQHGEVSPLPLIRSGK